MITQDCFVNGSVFSIPANCCCTLTCTLTTDQLGGEDLIFLSVFAKGNVTDVKIDGLPPSFPYFINTTATLEFTYCAEATPTSEQLQIDIVGGSGQNVTVVTLDGLGGELFNPTSVDFGNVVVGNSIGVGITMNPRSNLLCCNTFNVNQLTGNFVVDALSVNLCANAQQEFIAYFQPSSVGLFSTAIRLTINRCLSLNFPLTGRGIEQPSGGGGNPVSGPPKKVVDCPTDCKLFNPQPGFSQKTKNAINQISRATSPKGGPGRGTNFRK